MKCNSSIPFPGSAHKWHGVNVDLPCKVRTDKFPVVTAVGALEHILGTKVKCFVVEVTDKVRGIPMEAVCSCFREPWGPDTG